jgi:hypothetical protein
MLSARAVADANVLRVARLDDDDVAAIGDTLRHRIIEGGEGRIVGSAIAVRTGAAMLLESGAVGNPEHLAGVGLEDGDVADGNAVGEAIRIVRSWASVKLLKRSFEHRFQVSRRLA